MPTYEYECDACGKNWELEQRISDKPVKKCPKCGKMKARRMISLGGGFQLKGGGWYADGYGSSKGGSSKGDSGDSSSGSDSGSGPGSSSGSSSSGDTSSSKAAE